MLLIGAGVLIRCLIHQMNVNLGYDPTNLLTAELRLPENEYPEPEQQIAFFSLLREEVEALPGLTDVGLETEPTDPTTFAGVSVFLALVAFLACLLPACRASRVNPVDALRAE